ncbi:hypothetical protein ACFPM0_14425 [Pseudonocardia sulfidoxydans]|uniref:hypothetical protein n=1 Tax=Pseudonocardia sulfidoxydans TaxID=54011 RepID=UPI00361E87A5
MENPAPGTGALAARLPPSPRTFWADRPVSAVVTPPAGCAPIRKHTRRTHNLSGRLRARFGAPLGFSVPARFARPPRGPKSAARQNLPDRPRPASASTGVRSRSPPFSHRGRP